MVSRHVKCSGLPGGRGGEGEGGGGREGERKEMVHIYMGRR